MQIEPTFEEIHAPGSRILTASRWPCLILPPEQRPTWLCSPYELGAHMLGLRPMPEPGDEVRRGKQLEGVALRMLEEELGEELEGQTWVTHEWLDAGATLDGISRAGIAAETKVVDGRDFDREWLSGPPLYPSLQAQCQIACTGQDHGWIGALVLRHKKLEMHTFRVERHDRIVDLLESAGKRFIGNIQMDRLPEPDVSPSSYAAMQDLVEIEKGATISVPGSEALERARKWRQAQADAAAAEKTIAAQKQWFAANVNDAAIIELDDGSEIKRTQRKRAAHECKESTYWQWKV